MSMIVELLRAEEDGSLSFGNYSLAKKEKLDNFEHQGDIYKVKTYKGITRLEKNDNFVFESVPGTVVNNMEFAADGVSFIIEGESDVQLTLELKEDTTYSVCVDGGEIGRMATNMSGKLSFGLELGEGARKIDIKEC